MAILGLIFILLNVLDGALTYLGIKLGMIELNPLVDIMGWNAMIVFKFFVAFGIPIVSAQIDKKASFPIGTYVMNTVVILLILTCIWNCIQIIIHLQGGISDGRYHIFWL